MTATVARRKVTVRRPRGGGAGPFGVLTPDKASVVGGFATGLLASVYARQHDCDDFIVLSATTRGWRTRDGKTPQQAAQERWGTHPHEQAG